MPPTLESYADFDIPLLTIMSDFPAGRATVREVLAAFWDHYEVMIPLQHRVPLENRNECKWENMVRWARNTLVKCGLMDAPRYGVWGITPAGREWLDQHPDATHLDMSVPVAPRATPVSAALPRRQPAAAVPPGITLEKLERIRMVMSPDDFRNDWGAIYDRLVAEDRARWTTELNDRQLAERARPLVRRVQDFLQGKATEAPKSEVICDWIYLCYSLDLFREGAALWRYVNQDGIDGWQYKRTEKLAAACRVRAGS